MKKQTISEFVNTEWREFFDHVSQSKNATLPYEGMLACERKVLYAAKMLPGFSDTNVTLTRKLASDTGLYHISGTASVEETIKSMGSSYKRQHEVMLLKGVGSFPTSLSNPGAAARYTKVLMTPLSMQMAADTDFCEYFLDDSGVVQPRYIIPPMPLAVIRTMKNIGIGKSCFIMERPHDEVISWAREVIDKAWSGQSTGFAKTYYNETKELGFTTPEEFRNFETTARHRRVNKPTMSEIYNITPPDPFIHTGCNVVYDRDKHVVWMEAKVEELKESGSRKKRYIVTDLPIEISDKTVMASIKKKYGDSIMSKVIDRSGDGHPIYLEIPKSIFDDKENWSAIGLKKALVEQYVFWDENLKAPRMYNHIHEVVLEWFKKREEVVTKRLSYNASVYNRKIYQNNLIKKYYEDTVLSGGKLMKSEEEVCAKYGDVDGKYLYSLPQRTYLPKNVESIDKKNEDMSNKLKDIEKNIRNIKDYIFKEWRTIADKNNKFFEGEL